MSNLKTLFTIGLLSAIIGMLALALIPGLPDYVAVIMAYLTGFAAKAIADTIKSL